MALPTLKIENAKFLITVDESRRIIEKGSVLVEGQRISKVDKAFNLRATKADIVIDATNMVVIPGLINAHLHISSGHLTSGLLPDYLDRSEHISGVAKVNVAMTEDEEHDVSLLAITEALKYGTTCLVDPGTTKFLDSCVSACKKSGSRIVIGRHMLDLPNPRQIPLTSPSEARKLMEELICKYNHILDDRVRVWTMLWSLDHSSGDLLRMAKQVADENDTGMTVHCVNHDESIQYHTKKFGMRPVEYLDHIGVLGDNLLLSHVVGLNDVEVDCIARSNTKMVMCPPAALMSGSGTTVNGKLPEMIEKGICVSLGNDSPSYGPVETMRSMYLSAVLYKDARGDTEIIPAETALEMATINGARALGLDDEIGSIVVGKKADLVLFDIARPEWRNLSNPVNNLVYNVDGRSVHTVVVDGNVVIKNHMPTFVDEGELIEKVRRIGGDLANRTGISYAPKWPIL